MFLWHFPSGCPDRTLSCTLPYEARTFLTSPSTSSGRSAAIRRTPRPIVVECSYIDNMQFY